MRLGGVLAVALCPVLVSCRTAGPGAVPVTVFGERTATFQAEVAGSPVERMKGLMFREDLAPDQGMLFVYPESGRRSFWMMHTSIPLDILFIDSEKRVLNIREADPCRSSPCPRYLSRGPARYVLEIRRGLSKEFGFGPGTRVEFVLE